MKILFNKYILAFLILNLFGLNATCQISTQNLLSQLRNELFTGSEEKIPIYEHLGKPLIPYKVDSTHLTRKDQPDPVMVLELLEKLMHSKDAALIADIQKIYDQHILLFWEDWAQFE